MEKNTNNKLNPTQTYFGINGESGKELVKMTGKIVAECSHSGPCDDDVEANVGEVEWLGSDDDLRAFLRQTGAWDDLAEADTITLRQRTLWVCANDISENPVFYV